MFLQNRSDPTMHLKNQIMCSFRKPLQQAGETKQKDSVRVVRTPLLRGRGGHRKRHKAAGGTRESSPPPPPPTLKCPHPPARKRRQMSNKCSCRVSFLSSLQDPRGRSHDNNRCHKSLGFSSYSFSSLVFVLVDCLQVIQSMAIDESLKCRHSEG